MQLSVIILNYNVRYFLEQCVFSVQKALENMDAEIIVIDNNSSDDSCAMMKEKFPNVRLIENKENLGFPKGNNIGVAEAKGEYICILNPDTVVAEDVFEKVIARHEAISFEVGIIGCKLIDGTGNFLPESKRGVPTPWVAFTKIFGLYKLFPNSSWFNKYYAQHLSENQSGEVDILVGAFMVMKRDLYLEVGGFDEKCFMYSDDIDLSYMVKKSGKQNYYFADTTVIHYKGESTVRDGLYMKRFREAMQFFYKKHFRKSVFFDVIMQVGVLVFTFFKMFQGKSVQKTIPKAYVLISDNEDSNLICKQVSKVLKSNIVEFVKNDFKKQTCFIFDGNSISNKKIIIFMQTNMKKEFFYKIIPRSCNYLIGSNSSNDRGEVILMDNLGK
jgi:GT2 family glycosyltransferase